MYYTTINGKKVRVYEKDGEFYTYKKKKRVVDQTKIYIGSPTRKTRVSELESTINNLNKELSAAIESCSYQYEKSLRSNNIPEDIISRQRELIDRQRSLNDEIIKNKNLGQNVDDLENKLKLVTEEFQKTLKDIPTTIVTFFANQIELEKKKYKANIDKLRNAPAAIDLLKDNKQSLSNIAEMLNSPLDEVDLYNELETLKTNHEKLEQVLRNRSDELKTCVKKESEISAKLKNVEDEFNRFYTMYKNGVDLIREMDKLKTKLSEKERFHAFELKDCMRATEVMTRALTRTLDKTKTELNAVDACAQEYSFVVRDLEYGLQQCNEAKANIEEQYDTFAKETNLKLEMCIGMRDKCTASIAEYKALVDKYKRDMYEANVQREASYKEYKDKIDNDRHAEEVYCQDAFQLYQEREVEYKQQIKRLEEQYNLTKEQYDKMLKDVDQTDEHNKNRLLEEFEEKRKEMSILLDRANANIKQLEDRVQRAEEDRDKCRDDLLHGTDDHIKNLEKKIKKVEKERDQCLSDIETYDKVSIMRDELIKYLLPIVTKSLSQDEKLQLTKKFTIVHSIGDLLVLNNELHI